ncbi:MAG: hypothetical protein Q9166_000670 [cf. Caloplaca sp. 2 TL-2023]
MKATLLLLLIFLTHLITAQSNQTVISIPPVYTYLLPPTFQGNASLGFLNTQTSNAPLDALLATARSTLLISFSPTFLDILGPSPSITIAAQRSAPFATEGGIWVPDRNEVWFTSSDNVDDPSAISVLNLDTFTVTVPELDSPLVNPNGGYYYNGRVYFTFLGNETVAGGIASIDPATNKTTTLLNSYLGLPFNGPDDAVVVPNPNNNNNNNKKTYIFFTDPDYAQELNIRPQTASLPNAVWRFSMQDHSIQPVISRDDIRTPNGIKTNLATDKIYITDSTQDFPFGPFRGAGTGGAGFGSPAIWQYDLSSEGTTNTPRPVNKRLFAIARNGIPDGIQVDDLGNVWTAEGEGVVVRDSTGRVIGLVNAQAVLGGGEEALGVIANFALAGDKVVVLAGERVFVVRLGKVVLGPGRFGG